MTIALYARRKQWPLEEVTVRLQHSRIHATDCAECETRDGMLDRIETDIALTGALTPEQRTRLLEIAEKCPVHRTLTSEISIKTRLAEAASPCADQVALDAASILLPPRMNDASSATIMSTRHAKYVTFIAATKAPGCSALGMASAAPA